MYCATLPPRHSRRSRQRRDLHCVMTEPQGLCESQGQLAALPGTSSCQSSCLASTALAPAPQPAHRVTAASIGPLQVSQCRQLSETGAYCCTCCSLASPVVRPLPPIPPPPGLECDCSMEAWSCASWVSRALGWLPQPAASLAGQARQV